MFGRRFTLFRIFGFQVRADPSWLVIAALVTWSLAAGAFPYYYRGLGQGTYWAMGVVGALGLFASILLHELSHSLVGRRHGQEVKGITLWIFGGIAETADEARDPRSELLMAAAGPAASFVLGALFALLRWGAGAAAAPVPVLGVLAYLAWVNVLLGAFNLVPAFPLDGGRILRAWLWQRRGAMLPATRTAAAFGNAFGWALMGLGVLSALGGSLIGGLWWVLIGSFVRTAAKGSYRQLVASKVLEGAPVRRMMDPHPATVSRGTPVDRFVEDYVYARGERFFPVMDGLRVVGWVDAGAVHDVPRGEWPHHTVGELTRALSDDTAIPPEADAAEAMRRLQRSGRAGLVVTDDGRLEGVLSLEDLRRYLAIRAELEGEAGRSPRA